MSESKGLRAWLVLCVVSLASVVQAEDVTVTTYYPSPRGNYQTLNSTSNTNLATATATDRVGIGTTSPSAKLTVIGQATFGDTSFAPPGSEPLSTNGWGSGISMEDRNVGLGFPRWVIYPRGGSLHFWQASDLLTISSSGRVDIVPAGGDLYINGSQVCRASGTGCPASSGLPAGVANQTLRHNGTSWVADSNLVNTGVNVGIGTASPDGLQINAAVSETARAANNVRLGVLGTPRIILEASGATQWELDNVGGRFRIFNPGVEQFTIDSAGNVGIGTTLPGQKLDVVGNINIGSTNNYMRGGIAGTSIICTTGTPNGITIAGGIVTVAGGCTPLGGGGGSLTSLTLTTTGTSGAATLSPTNPWTTGAATLNIPVYSGGGGGVTGSGTTNFVAKWTPSGTQLGNSNIFDDGTDFRYGTTPLAGFDYNAAGDDLYLGGAGAQAGNLFIKDASGIIRVQINSDTTSSFTSDLTVGGQQVCRANVAIAGCPAGGAAGVGPGTANFVAKFNAAGTNVVNSVIFDDGTNVGIGGASPFGAKLDVNGAVRLGPSGVYDTWFGYAGADAYVTGANIYLRGGSPQGWPIVAQVTASPPDMYVNGQRICRANGVGCPAITTGIASGTGSGFLAAPCPGGYTVTGGGFYLASNFASTPPYNIASYPLAGLTSWGCQLNGINSGAAWNCYAVCMQH